MTRMERAEEDNGQEFLDEHADSFRLVQFNDCEARKAEYGALLTLIY
jgi:hypothetical protein